MLLVHLTALLLLLWSLRYSVAKFEAAFVANDVELPAATIAVINVSHVARSFWIPILLAAMAVDAAVVLTFRDWGPRTRLLVAAWSYGWMLLVTLTLAIINCVWGAAAQGFAGRR
jgi:type II secretory pathway component PulF